MLRLWPEILHIEVHPRQVLLLRLSRNRTPRILEKSLIRCPAVSREQPIWRDAVDTLAGTLPGFFSGKGEATIVLSNHFIRYGIFQNTINVTRHDEELALVQHQFSRIYGNIASQWQYCLSSVEKFNTPRVACAVDMALIDSLHGLFKDQKSTIRSVQPYLMTIFNQYRHRFAKTCWLAVVEEEMLCLARLKSGNWQSVKTFRIDKCWRQDLVTLIEREKLLSASSSAEETAPEPVLVFSPEYHEPVNIAPENYPESDIDTTHITVLDPTLWPEPSGSENTNHALAITG